ARGGEEGGRERGAEEILFPRSWRHREGMGGGSTEGGRFKGQCLGEKRLPADVKLPTGEGHHGKRRLSRGESPRRCRRRRDRQCDEAWQPGGGSRPKPKIVLSLVARSAEKLLFEGPP